MSIPLFFNISLMNSHRYTQNNSSFGVLKDVKGLPSSVECKLIEEREALFTELRDVGIELVSRTPSSNILYIGKFPCYKRFA